MLLAQRFTSFEEAALGLSGEAPFAYLPNEQSHDQKLEESAQRLMRVLCTTSKRELIASIGAVVRAAHEGTTFPADASAPELQPALYSLFRLFSDLAKAFTYSPSELIVRLIIPKYGERNMLGLKTFHTDRLPEFIFLHTLAAERISEGVGTEVAVVSRERHAELLMHDNQFGTLRKQRGGLPKEAEEQKIAVGRQMEEVRAHMNSLIPQEAILPTNLRDTLLLRSDNNYPTFHRGPDLPIKRVLIGMPNLKLKG